MQQFFKASSVKRWAKEVALRLVTARFLQKPALKIRFNASSDDFHAHVVPDIDQCLGKAAATRPVTDLIYR